MPLTAYQAEQIEVLRRIAERGYRCAEHNAYMVLGGHDVPNNQWGRSMDQWLHLLDELDRLHRGAP
jgi:hypothetical protein